MGSGFYGSWIGEGEGGFVLLAYWVDGSVRGLSDLSSLICSSRFLAQFVYLLLFSARRSEQEQGAPCKSREEEEEEEEERGSRPLPPCLFLPRTVLSRTRGGDGSVRQEGGHGVA